MGTLTHLKKNATIAVILLVLGAADAAWTAPQKTFDGWHNGAGGFQKAMHDRESTQQPALIYFYTDWCPYCRRLDNDLFASEAVQRYLGGFAKVRINPEHGMAAMSLAKEFRIGGYPSVFVSPGGSDDAIPLYLFRNKSLVSPDEFMQMCQAVTAKAPNRTTTTPRPARRKSPVMLMSEIEPPSPLDPENQVTLHLKNGREVTGTVVRETPEGVVLGWEGGEATFSHAEINRVVKVPPSGAAGN